jgi:hypothetical protein
MRTLENIILTDTIRLSSAPEDLSMINNEMKEDLLVGCLQGKFVFLYAATLVTAVISYRCVNLQGRGGSQQTGFFRLLNAISRGKRRAPSFVCDRLRHNLQVPWIVKNKRRGLGLKGWSQK